MNEDIRKLFLDIQIDPRFKGSGTTALTNILRTKVETGHINEAVQIWQLVYNYWSQIRKHHSGRIRAESLHERADAMIDITLTQAQTSCRRGCAHCCKIEITITDDEAILLSQLVKSGTDIDITKLREQAKLGEGEKWDQASTEERTCVFLDKDNNCRVYNNRPLNCRKYYVVSPPDKCADYNGRSKVYAINGAEALASATLNLKPKFGTMAVKLLEKLEL